HAVDEDAARLAPPQRQIDLLLVAAHHSERALAVEAFMQPLRVAVVAAWRHLRAAGDRVPGGIGPFDGAVISHVGSPWWVGKGQDARRKWILFASGRRQREHQPL